MARISKIRRFMITSACTTAFIFISTSANAQEVSCAGWPVPNACSKAASFADKAEIEIDWDQKHRSLLSAAVNYKICGDEARATEQQSRATLLLEANISDSAPQTDNLMIQMMVDNLIQYGPACERLSKGGSE